MSDKVLGKLTSRSIDAVALPLLAAALQAEGLPTSDLADPAGAFFEFRDGDGTLIGFAGLQQFDALALLRSLVVLPEARGRANGSAIVDWLVAEAVRRGVRHLYLLTMSAAPFFEKLRFRRADRSEAPAAIAVTAEFASLCPAAAVFMHRATSGRARRSPQPAQPAPHQHSRR